MPVLKKEDLVSINLPSYGEEHPAIVKINRLITVSELKGVLDSGAEGMEASIQFLALAIKEWNITDKEGKVLPINVENVSLLSAPDLLYLVKTAGFNKMVEEGLSPQEKKI